MTLIEGAQNCCATSRADFGGVWSADNFGLPYSSPPHSHRMTIRKQNKKMNGDGSMLLVQSCFIKNNVASWSFRNVVVAFASTMRTTATTRL